MPLIERLAGLPEWAGSFFTEKVHVKTTFVYNAGQVILSATQHFHPEWAGSILKAQRSFIVLDATFLALDTWQVYRKLRKIPDNHNRNPRVGDILLLLFLSSISAAAVFVLNHTRFKPADDLTEILKKVAPPEEIKNVSIYWDKPWIHAMSQWISLNRCFFQGFSYWDRGPASRTYFTNAGLQLVHFFHISRLPFLTYQHVFSRTLSSNGIVRTDKIVHSFYFLVTSLKDNNYLPLAVQTMHDYCTRIVRQFPRNFSWPINDFLWYLNSIYIPIPNSLCNPAPFYHHLFISAETLKLKQDTTL
jgi:hypothetical protein